MIDHRFRQLSMQTFKRSLFLAALGNYFCLGTLPADWKSFIHPETMRTFLGRNTSLQYSSNRFEGDITSIDNEDSVEMVASQEKNVINDETKRWPNGAVPYIISNSFNDDDRRMILQAMSIITRATTGCIKFIQRTNEADYVRFARLVGCYSDVGRQRGKQVISLERGCMDNIGTIQHEILHTLGLYHEISRTDRDEFVHINWGNIQPGNAKQFAIHTDVNSYGLPYDYQSVMHYPINAFAVDPKIPTILPKIKRTRIGDYRVLSPIDVIKIQKTYRCYNDPETLIDQTVELATTNAVGVRTFTTSPPDTGGDEFPEEEAPVFRGITTQDCNLLLHCDDNSFADNCTDLTFIKVDMVFKCKPADGKMVMSRAKTLGVGRRLHLQMDEKTTEPDFFASTGSAVSSLTLFNCSDQFTTARLPAFSLGNLLGYGLCHCRQLSVQKADFTQTAKLRLIMFTDVTFAAIEKDTFTNLPDLKHLTLEHYYSLKALKENDHEASILRIHCGCEYVWLRAWIKRKPKVVAPKTWAESYQMDVPFETSRFQVAIQQSKVFVPVDCSTKNVAEFVNTESASEFTVNDSCI